MIFRANEAKANQQSALKARVDLKRWVMIIGDVLSMTQNEIKDAYLDDKDNIHISFKDGSEMRLKINSKEYTYGQILKAVADKLF